LAQEEQEGLLGHPQLRARKETMAEIRSLQLVRIATYAKAEREEQMLQFVSMAVAAVHQL
jgi:hypothetical protein